MCPSPPHLLLPSCVLCDKRMQVDTLLCVHLLLTLCVLCDKRTQVDTLLCVHLPHISSLPRAFCVTNACRSIRYYASISSLPRAFCVTNARRSIRYYVSISSTNPPYLVRYVLCVTNARRSTGWPRRHRWTLPKQQVCVCVVCGVCVCV